MTGIIIYYSQTGNTKKIAEAIYTGAASMCKQIDLLHISDVNFQSLKDYDFIGIGTPVWCEWVPANVRKLIESMIDVEGKYVFVFCTHATLAGRFMKRIVSSLEEKKMIVVGWEDWYGGNVNPLSEKPYYTDGHPDDFDLKEALDFGKDMMEKCIRIANGNHSLIPRLPQGQDYAARYGELRPSAPTEKSPNKTEDKKPVILLNREICNFPACSLCKDNCPAKSIDPSRENPMDESSCEHCHFCEFLCPTGAITFPRRMHIDKNNPTFKKLTDELLEYKELRRFRPLVPFDEVGTIMPSEEDHNRHPKFVLDQGVGVLAPKKK